MSHVEPTSTLLVARAQAWFEAFVALESLQPFNPEWVSSFNVPAPGVMSVHAWLGRGPLQQPIGDSVFPYFENGEEQYPVLNLPGIGPRGGSLRGAKTPRILTTDENTAIFSLEVILPVPVPNAEFEKAQTGAFDDAIARPVLSSAKAALDTIVGAFALYQYPLVWRPITERHVYTLVNVQKEPKASQYRETREVDNFIPFRLDAASKLINGALVDELIKQVGTVLNQSAKEPLIFLKDSMWHADIRTRFLLQFWILEYFAERHANQTPVADEIREFVDKLEAMVKTHAPDDLPLFRLKKGSLLRRTLTDKVKACLEHFRISYDDAVFKKAKRVRDHLSHGAGYDQEDLIKMELYIREVARYLIQRDLEYKGIVLDKGATTVAELPLIVPLSLRDPSRRTSETITL